MKKNLTELVFILDRSGSMGGLEQDTIGGFNAMLTRQKEQEGEANVTTILFDHEVQAFSSPSVVMTKMTFSARSSSGRWRWIFTIFSTP